MPRRRVSASPELGWRQDQALGSTMRVVRELGPTAFVLQEEEQQAAEYRVSLGNPHSCTCSVFVKDKDLCKHICWLLLKKFKLPRDHEYALQLGLVEREINYMLQGLQVAPQPRITARDLKGADDGYIKQKEIDNEDVCPICYNTLLKKMLPVTYCRFGCGNNVHILCMKIWADHQTELEKDSLVKCPLCREHFAPLKLILEEFRNSKRLMTVAEKQRLDKHLGIPCNNCRVFPIEGNCYKCTECAEYYLCYWCYKSFCHPHPFVFREKRNQRWRSVEPIGQLSTEEQSKEEKDKEIFSCTPEHIVNSLPTVLVRKCSSLLDPGLQCRLCLKIFCLGQVARYLPCNHKFHRKCIDRWLHKENACPIDGHLVYNPLTWEDVPTKGNPLASQAKMYLEKQIEQELFIPGTGLLVQQMKPGLIPDSCFSSPQGCLEKKKSPSESEKKLTLNGLSSTSAGDLNPSLYSTQKIRNLKFSRYVKGLALTPKPRADVFTEKAIGTSLSGLYINGNAK
ncbi:E3 ubiquitin-protein ligase ZSWIM2 isoform X3 [Varanus komodoensis]|nr:E3 ubiquitin-protein ligase ZSWIM2 isoform X3 [Varanus komodoensis]